MNEFPQFRRSFPLYLALCLFGSLLANSGGYSQEAKPTKPLVEGAEEGEPRVIVGGIRVGKETTFIMGPIEENRIDYLEALNQELAKGVTPATNAAAAYWQAIGPNSEFLKNVDGKELFRRLGVDPVDDLQWRTFQEEVKLEHGDDRDRMQEALKSLDETMEQPWRQGAHPLVSRWLAANEASLKKITTGLKRPHWYSPLVWRKPGEGGDDSEQTLIVAAFVNVESPRQVARALIARAMQKLSDGEHEAAWEDVLACHRLARHMSQGTSSLIDMLVGIAIDGMACEAVSTMVQLPLPLELLQKMQKDRASLQGFQATAKVLDRRERFMFLDAVMNIAAGRGVDPLLGNDAFVRKLLSASIDWNETLRLGNENYDRIVALANLPTYAARHAAHQKYTEELKEMLKRPSAFTLAAMLLSGSADKLVGKQIGKILVSLLLPAVFQAKVAEDRAVNMDRMTNLAISVAIYQRKNGRYPERLSMLRLDRLPADLFSGKPFVYKRTKAGFLLYDVGPNQRDDGGRGPYNDGDYPEQDDNVLEVGR